ncbi:hypothetical protein AC578_11100 [Pseudocercospora eumusae]|uniref:Secreted protein n=1 Tax=Pseudocercospora eumusae TaxID=321146 RepID=A0A139HSV9_9PEZI|nr:hypothetical protein AC578_11100 [Pseudocercospora eumusae]
MSPSRLAMLLLCALNAKGSMLVWHDMVLVIGIDGLVLRCDLNLFCRQLDSGKVFEQIGVVGVVQVQKGQRGDKKKVWLNAQYAGPWVPRVAA